MRTSAATVSPLPKHVRDTTLSVCAEIVDSPTVLVLDTGYSVVIIEVTHG